MKIFSAQQIKAWDNDTKASKHIKTIDLMETAANAFAHKYMATYGIGNPVAVFCGTGNNGGDGLAIARILSISGYDVNVWLADFGQSQSDDFNINLGLLPNFGHIPLEVINMNEPPSLDPNTIIIDALVGIGLNRPIDGKMEDLVHWLNTLHHTVVAVDIPSGMFPDNHTTYAIEADHTITFQSAKLSFLLPSYERFTGKCSIVDIGLSENYAIKTHTDHYLIDKNLIKKLIQKRKKFSHKGLYGHALLINGSYGKAGAAILAAKGCLRSGVGLVTSHVPVNLYTIMQMTVPETMVSVDAHDFYWSTLPDDISNFAAIGVGCGIDQKESTVRIFKSLVESYQGRLVLDADALNILSQYPELLSKLPSGTILTPHVKEFERLFGKSKNCFERLELIKTKAREHNITILLKGAHSQIAFNDGTVYFNCSGNPGMATAGSGDVLTGILTALLAQGYDTQSAALIGTYIHGLAGDFAYLNNSYESVIASDIIDHLGEAFHTLFN